jgi:hypothetical protein
MNNHHLVSGNARPMSCQNPAELSGKWNQGRRQAYYWGIPYYFPVPPIRTSIGRSHSASFGSASWILRVCTIIVMSLEAVEWGQNVWVLSKAMVGTVASPQLFFAPKRTTLRGPEVEDRYSTALTTKFDFQLSPTSGLRWRAWRWSLNDSCRPRRSA